MIIKNYIKISFHGTIYGPIEALSPFHIVCKHMKVSIKSNPSLQSIQNPNFVIVDGKTIVPSGFYKLHALGDVKFEHVEEESNFAVKRVAHHSIDTQKDKAGVINHNLPSSLPLGKTEMDIVMQGMLHLISSVPPRYIVSLSLILEIQQGSRFTNPDFI
jgi:hypothetical protein